MYSDTHSGVLRVSVASKRRVHSHIIDVELAIARGQRVNPSRGFALSRLRVAARATTPAGGVDAFHLCSSRHCRVVSTHSNRRPRMSRLLVSRRTISAVSHSARNMPSLLRYRFAGQPVALVRSQPSRSALRAISARFDAVVVSVPMTLRFGLRYRRTGGEGRASARRAFRRLVRALLPRRGGPQESMPTAILLRTHERNDVALLAWPEVFWSPPVHKPHCPPSRSGSSRAGA